MNWDWEKLQQRKEKNTFQVKGPDFSSFEKKIGNLKSKLPGGSVLLLIGILLWLLSGIYIVEPDEVGVVQRFGKFNRITPPGPHYHLPYPIEKVQTPKVTRIQRVEIGFRTLSKNLISKNIQYRLVPEESLMLTGDENIVDVQFIVQYQIKDPQYYLFNIADPEKTVKDAAEAAMREVIGNNDIDSALTTGKLIIQNDTKRLLQEILDRYHSGIRIVAVQLQDVHPPRQVIDAFKDVASAKEDKIRYINEAEAYRNDILPKTRGEVAQILNEAQAYKESVVRKAKGETARFLSVFKEYKRAKDVTRKRLYLETVEKILSNPQINKIILSDKAAKSVVPYLFLKNENGKLKGSK
ncbi:protease FtsH subunit HflK [Desulfonauticus submarinus]|uniref:Protein HflK n=1 Tax=Desulfonauticus submarinus TaxID=206665 RepID=A0A1H0CPF4_9BACT|nr:FtsH protease activity modulator HflK [Desulfonauticus submarinus]SDN59777.1 protease FtsH subunit HflK [Desulfonauticus submarinus]